MTIKDEVFFRLFAGEDYKTFFNPLRGKEPFYEG